MVAFARGLAHGGCTHVRGFADPTARPLLPPVWAARLDAVLVRHRRGGHSSLRRIGDLMALRTLAIDAPVREAVAGGARQVVILGAGLDGRAFRMAELAAVDLFEVDHPDSQAPKRQRAAALTAQARTV